MRSTEGWVLAVSLLVPGISAAQENTPAAGDVHEFVAQLEQNIEASDQAYTDLANENLPLRNDAGQPLGRHHIEDRRQALATLRETVQHFSAEPEDLVLATTLLIQSEALVDDLFDLSQTAYDNDREELAKRLTDLETNVGRNKDFLETYTLNLARASKQRIRELEKENQDLQEKLKEALARARPRSLRH